MIQERVDNTLITNSTNSSGFTMKPNAKAFKILSDGLYSNKIRAVCREYLTNARDSHVDAGVDLPIKIHVPTSLDPYFEIQDFGVGLSEQEILDIYTVYFESTKTQTNTTTGCFGLGSKSAFSVSDQFNVTSVKDGVKVGYNCYINEEDFPDAALLFKNKTTDPNGTTIRVPVDISEIQSWHSELSFVLIPYEKHQYELSSMIPNYNTELEQAVLQESNIYLSEFTGIYAVMGNVMYRVDDYKEYLPDPILKLVYGLGIGAILHFELGEVDVTPSREQLSFDKKTTKVFKKKLNKLIIQKYRELLQDNDPTNYWHMYNTFNGCEEIWKRFEDSPDLPYVGKGGYDTNTLSRMNMYNRVCYPISFKVSCICENPITWNVGIKKTDRITQRSLQGFGEEVTVLYTEEKVRSRKHILESAYEKYEHPVLLADTKQELEDCLKYFMTDKWVDAKQFDITGKRKTGVRRKSEGSVLLCEYYTPNSVGTDLVDVAKHKVAYIEANKGLKNISIQNSMKLLGLDYVVIGKPRLMKFVEMNNLENLEMLWKNFLKENKPKLKQHYLAMKFNKPNLNWKEVIVGEKCKTLQRLNNFVSKFEPVEGFASICGLDDLVSAIPEVRRYNTLREKFDQELSDKKSKLPLYNMFSTYQNGQEDNFKHYLKLEKF